MPIIPASPNLGTGPTNQQGPFPQPGSTTPTDQQIGPLPASTMPGQLAQTIPVMANFQFILGQLNNLQNQINNMITTGPPVIHIDTTLPITGGPITATGVIGHAVSGVQPGLYGDSLNVPQLFVDKFGHIDTVKNVPISGTGGGFIQADYVLYPVGNAAITNYRLLTAGTNITITDGGPQGAVTINAPSGTGGFTKSQLFTGAGTYTFNVPANVSFVWLTGSGAGGGAGGAPANTNAAGGGGGSGEICENLMWPVTPGGTATVIIGAAGTGGTAANGTTGGTTSFNNGSITARLLGGGPGSSSGTAGVGGGPGGAQQGAQVTPFAGLMGILESPVHFGGSSGGTGGALANFDGSTGAPGPGNFLGAAGGAHSGSVRGGGGGASSPWGLGGPGGAANTNGANGPATSYGSGGGGSGGDGLGSARTGGNATDGVMLVGWVG